MDSSTVNVKHDPKVNGYAAQDCKTVDKCPIGGVQRDLRHEEKANTDVHSPTKLHQTTISDLTCH